MNAKTVTVVMGRDCAGEQVVITEGSPPELGQFFVGHVNGEVWGTCQSPTALSQHAFDRGAASVRHDYNLVAAHSRFYGG